MRMWGVLIFCVSLTTGAMGFGDIEKFFPQIEGNLTKVVWAHAVNNIKLLNQTLNDTKIMMIEADVQMGTLVNSSTTIPIMAHPPNTTSDLSLEMFLQKVDDHNKLGGSQKGIKLDFKQIDAFLNSTAILRSYSNKNYPAWINADILPGNQSYKEVIPVNASRFLNGAKEFKDAWLSIGWTTAGMTGQYSDQNIREMVDTLKPLNLSNRITFPVRASLAARSNQQMVNLLNEIKNSTLTIWSSEGDNVSVDQLRTVIANVGVNKIFIDVPNNLMSKLKLNNLPKKNNAIAAFATSLPILLVTLFLFL